MAPAYDTGVFTTVRRLLNIFTIYMGCCEEFDPKCSGDELFIVTGFVDDEKEGRPVMADDAMGAAGEINIERKYGQIGEEKAERKIKELWEDIERPKPPDPDDRVMSTMWYQVTQTNEMSENCQERWGRHLKLLEDRVMFEEHLEKEMDEMWLSKEWEEMWLAGIEVPVVHLSVPSPFTHPVLNNPEIIHIGDGQKFLKEFGGEGVPVMVEQVKEDLGPVHLVHETECEVYDRLVAQMQRNCPSLSSDETDRYILELSGMGFDDIVERIGIDIERDREEEEPFHECQEENWRC